METESKLVESSEKVKKQIFPDVPIVFPAKFPQGYRPWLDGWSFSEEEMMETTDDGTLKLLTLDISISSDDYVEAVNTGPVEEISERAEKEIKCEIGCEHCFECRTDTNNPIMSFDEIKKMVLEAKELGLKSVKFLGPGELLHNPDLFAILDFFESEEIKICIFTKGVILGDNELSQKIFAISPKELTEKIQAYKCVRLLVGFISADPVTEDNRLKTSISNLSEKRNIGIENAVACGFNNDLNNQRLALICAPVLRDNVDEVADIYDWAVRRNIPLIVAPTMVSGKGKNLPEVTDEHFKRVLLVNLYTSIYKKMIEDGIITIEQIEKEGISPYAGYACNQYISGMFVRKDGRVQACPGNESVLFRYCDDIRNENLKEVWKKSMGYSFRKKMIDNGSLKLTQPCFAKTESGLVPVGSIPNGFYDAVLDRLKKQD